jgi:hypothetical protein
VNAEAALLGGAADDSFNAQPVLVTPCSSATPNGVHL